jgi:integrase
MPKFGPSGDRPVSGFSKCKSILDDGCGGFSEPWTLHDLRRTFRTRLSGLAISSDIAEKVVNHVPKDVRHVYDLHRYREEKRAALEAWAARLSGILEGPPPAHVVDLRERLG